MKCGKLSNDVLNDIIIKGIKKKNKDIIVGPKVGEDCSIIKFGEDICVLTTDPITAAKNNAGRIGVHICCNDIASSGVRPIGILITILAPTECSIDDIKKVMDEINNACEELNIDVLGGHTEITDAVNKIVLSLTAIGKGINGKYITTSGAQLGDDIVVAGYAASEGTAIIASDYYEQLRGKINDDILIKAQSFINDISVVKIGFVASEFGVNAMHDATEGGVLGAIWEVTEASDKGAYIYKDKIPVREETKIICKELNIDPLRLISSGCMIISCCNGDGLVKRLKECGIEAEVVGKIIKEGRILFSEGKEIELFPPDSDEIYKVSL
ncbi:AIR synthase [Caloramator sp. E03]|uniref:AIR synthase family protein n=1 Tax=Caloramator sp. E03 TaxID=2576307 RepID=UPI0011101AB4|nr:AIR synthase family protein [Caloramator sp. E03]QCX33085.1 AIR synthase [Caloramator sp. E03]